MQNRLPFRKAMRISRSEGDDGGEPSTEEGIVGTGSEAGTFGHCVDAYMKSRTGLGVWDPEFLLAVLVKKQ